MRACVRRQWRLDHCELGRARGGGSVISTRMLALCGAWLDEGCSSSCASMSLCGPQTTTHAHHSRSAARPDSSPIALRSFEHTPTLASPPVITACSQHHNNDAALAGGIFLSCRKSVRTERHRKPVRLAVELPPRRARAPLSHWQLGPRHGSSVPVRAQSHH